MATRRKAAPGGKLAAACCLGLGLLALRGPWLPGAAQVPAGEAPQGGCEAALGAGTKTFQSAVDSWTAAAEKGRLLPNFGLAAEKAEGQALADFDRALDEEGACAAQRQALQALIRKAAWSTFLAQRKLAEQEQGGAFADRLIGAMKKRGGPLRVQEKVEMLQDAVRSYNSKVQQLLPEWAKEQGDPEKDEAERRFGEFQFRIEDSAPGRVLQAKWAKDKQREAVNHRAHGVSVSLDPGLRVMLRPEGLGNLQIFSVGPMGSPASPSEVQIGILNDGSIADVYREHPVPPLLHVQPAVKVNVNLGSP